MNYDNLFTVLGIVLFLFVCVGMILIVLIQRPQGGGLSGAFGAGAGSGQTAFGTKTGDALTYATIGMFIAFLVLAVVLNFAARPQATPTLPAGGTVQSADPAAGVGTTSTSAVDDEADADVITPETNTDPSDAAATEPPSEVQGDSTESQSP